MEKLFYFLLLLIIFSSCDSIDKRFEEENKTFHAAPSTSGIGSLYFALYKDNNYRICNSGGVGENCYIGKYLANGDTITLNKLNIESSLKYNRFIIKRYSEQDSSYWKWKYIRSNRPWSELKELDILMGGTGDIYQIDKKNNIAQYEYSFIIRLDSLQNTANDLK